MISDIISCVPTWKERAHSLKVQTYALYLAYRDPRVPWYAKVFIFLVVAYAFSPIDLIPDFIPVLGYLDDLVLIPLGVWLALKMIPVEVMEEARIRAREGIASGSPEFKWMGVTVVGLWVVSLGIVALIAYRLFIK